MVELPPLMAALAWNPADRIRRDGAGAVGVGRDDNAGARVLTDRVRRRSRRHAVDRRRDLEVTYRLGRRIGDIRQCHRERVASCDGVGLQRDRDLTTGERGARRHEVPVLRGVSYENAVHGGEVGRAVVAVKLIVPPTATALDALKLMVYVAGAAAAVSRARRWRS